MTLLASKLHFSPLHLSQPLYPRPNLRISWGEISISDITVGCLYVYAQQCHPFSPVVSLSKGRVKTPRSLGTAWKKVKRWSFTAGLEVIRTSSALDLRWDLDVGPNAPHSGCREHQRELCISLVRSRYRVVSHVGRQRRGSLSRLFLSVLLYTVY